MQNSRDLKSSPWKTWWKHSIYKDSTVSVGVNEVKNITMEKNGWKSPFPSMEKRWLVYHTKGSHVIGISCTLRLLGHNIPEKFPNFFFGRGNSGLHAFSETSFTCGVFPGKPPPPAKMMEIQRIMWAMPTTPTRRGQCQNAECSRDGEVNDFDKPTLWERDRYNLPY